MDSPSVACIYIICLYFLRDGISVEKSHTSADQPAACATLDSVAPTAADFP